MCRVPSSVCSTPSHIHRRKGQPSVGRAPDLSNTPCSSASAPDRALPAAARIQLVPPRIRLHTASFRRRSSVQRSSFVGRMTTFVLQSGMKWGRTLMHSRTGVAGLLPLRHLGSTHPRPTRFERHGPWPFTEPSNTHLDAKNRLTVPSKFRSTLAGAVFLVKGAEPCLRLYPAETYEAMANAALANMNPLSAQKRELSRLFYANAMSMELDARGPRDAAAALHGARRDRLARGGRRRRRRLPRALGPRRPGSPTTPTSRSARLTSPHHLAILLDMPKTHVPVLAGELIEALDPQPGQIAVDCTLGAAGHARLVADRLGPTGLLIGIDRDPLAEAAFAELAAEAPCRTRFVRADFAAGLERCSRRACARTSSTSTSACPRCRSTRASAGSPTPTTRRSTCAWTPRRS